MNESPVQSEAQAPPHADESKPLGVIAWLTAIAEEVGIDKAEGFVVDLLTVPNPTPEAKRMLRFLLARGVSSELKICHLRLREKMHKMPQRTAAPDLKAEEEAGALIHRSWLMEQTTAIYHRSLASCTAEQLEDEIEVGGHIKLWCALYTELRSRLGEGQTVADVWTSEEAHRRYRRIFRV